MNLFRFAAVVMPMALVVSLDSVSAVTTHTPPPPEL